MGNSFNAPVRYRPGATRAIVTKMACLVALGIAFQAAAASARAQDIHDNLVVHLTFDGDVLDHSGNSNDGTIVRPEGNPTPFVPGIITQNRTSASAFRTLGPCLGTHMESNNYITFGVPAAGSGLDFGTDTDFSISFWGLIPAVGTTFHDPSWISNKDWDSGGNIGYVLAAQGPPYTPQTGGFKWNFTPATDTGDKGPRSDSFRCPNCALDDGQWHHYVVTFIRLGDGVTYIDGGQQGQNGQFDDVVLASGVGSLDAGFPVNVMQDGTGNYTDGSDCANWNDASISDLGIWKRALSGDEVANIYNQGLLGISVLD